jgi:hypothetical protein
MSHRSKAKMTSEESRRIDDQMLAALNDSGARPRPRSAPKQQWSPSAEERDAALIAVVWQIEEDRARLWAEQSGRPRRRLEITPDTRGVGRKRPFKMPGVIGTDVRSQLRLMESEATK